ncbi:phage minor head protein [Nocardiopsis tropica]|uniref:phage minor head protein n=1 Tax=Nocardiopsis tropica TaxID=109330 RepID=UPI002E84515C|nr:phage minor head protein [Nocardiopsis tropica]
MTTPTQTTPAQQLDAAEAQADAEIQAIITAAVAAGLSGAAVLAVLAALTGAVSAAAQRGFTVGAQIVLQGAAGRRARMRQLVVEPLPTTVEADVRAVVEDVARRIDSAIAGEPPDTTTAPVTVSPAAVELARFRRRMRILAITKIHQAASSATYSYARWLGLDLEWVTRRDGKACAVCGALNGRRVPSGEKFANPRRPGVPRKLWAGFEGLPPTHPSCRCRVIPRT